MFIKVHTIYVKGAMLTCLLVDWSVGKGKLCAPVHEPYESGHFQIFVSKGS